MQEFDFTISFGSQLVRIDESASDGTARPQHAAAKKIQDAVESVPKNLRGQNGSGIAAEARRHVSIEQAG